MYKITVIDLDDPFRKPYVVENVICWDCLSKEDIEMIEEERSNVQNENCKLSEEEIKEVARRCEHFEYMPNMEDLRMVISDVLKERE